MPDISYYKQIIAASGYTEKDSSTIVLRLQLILALKEELKKRKWTQREAARYLGVAQPRIAELSGLRVDKFSVETLARYLNKLNLTVSISIK